MDFGPGFYLSAVILLLSAEYILSSLSDWLDCRNAGSRIPEEFSGYYDPGKYAESRKYLAENARFALFSGAFFLVFTVSFILAGGFPFVDGLARSFGYGETVSGIIFVFILKFGTDILELPFEIYETFVIENKYGFNRTSPGTFILDFVKEWILSLLIGIPLLLAVLHIFTEYGAGAWIWVWAAMVAFQSFLSFIAPTVILPLFNRFKPLEKGPLKNEIEKYLSRRNFSFRGIYIMDGSRRTSKANAFFTGFGKFKKLVLYDTLLKSHSPEEITAVLAHEIGHYENRHIPASMLLSFLNLAFMLFVLSFFIGNENLSRAFGMEKPSVYSSIIFFGFIYSPVSTILSALSNAVSRKFEKTADEFAVRTYGRKEEFIKALKKLTVESLGNLNPHPLKVFLYFSHPPILDRIRHIRSLPARNRV